MRKARPAPLGRLSVLPLLAVAHAHHLGVDGRRHAVVHLPVDLGQRVACPGTHTLPSSARMCHSAPPARPLHKSHGQPFSTDAQLSSRHVRYMMSLWCQRPCALLCMCAASTFGSPSEPSITSPGVGQPADCSACMTLTLDDGGVLDVADGRRIHDVAHDEALDRLVLGHQHARGLAAHALHL